MKRWTEATGPVIGFVPVRGLGPNDFKNGPQTGALLCTVCDRPISGQKQIPNYVCTMCALEFFDRAHWSHKHGMPERAPFEGVATEAEPYACEHKMVTLGSGRRRCVYCEYEAKECPKENYSPQ